MNDNDCSRSSDTLDTIRQADVDTETSTNCGITHQQMLEKEAEFAQQRAKFMELFRQKEDELRTTREQLMEADKERSTLRQRLNELTSEVDDVKTAAAILQVGKDDEIAVAQRQYRDELASFQQIMDEAVSQAQQSATSKYEAERIDWLKHQQHLEAELQELRNKLSQDREGFLASITKTLQKRVTAAGQSRDEQDNLEYSMKKAQEDAELLRSVVSPLEEEINSLKVQLREARERSAQPVIKAESPCRTVPPVDVESNIVCDNVDGKVRELNMSLQTEKASRTDLEMYVAVLNTQKKALGDEMDKLRTQLQEVCQLLEREKLDHASLKRTWQMANDQFLESQRLLMADLRRMESLMTADQRVQLAELKSKEVKVEASAKAADEESSEHARVDSESRGELNESKDSAAVAQSTLDVSGASVNVSMTAENADSSTLNSSLTEAQQRSLLDPTPESERSRSLVSTALCKVDDTLQLEQKRLVSETEWEMLQKEIRETRERFGRACTSCASYESQLQSAREAERNAMAQLRGVERQLELERQAMDKQQKYTADLETSLQTVSDQTESQITTLANKQRESERFLSGVKQQLAQAQQDLYSELQRLTGDREEIQAELTRLQEENNSLIGKHSKHSQEMQDEAIDLPNTVEEMQLLVLKYREDLITAKVGLEHSEELLRSEIMFLRDQLVAEQQERSTMEESLAQEISGLQQELALRNSLGTELEREKQVRSDAETKQKDLEMSETQLRQTITDLQTQVQNLETGKSKYESDIHLLRLKVSSLQTDLENSEAVQRDFVKLSQSLQIQLEKIRASENEVRWQHEDDVDDCCNCKQTFSVTRRKHHCRHCGQIFCIDCLVKTVNSGPHQRPARVCDVCHTILVPDATPYFCSETLHTPN